MSSENIKEFANKLALHCQSALRGIKTRDKIQIKKWERANIAAYRIQVSCQRMLSGMAPEKLVVGSVSAMETFTVYE